MGQRLKQTVWLITRFTASEIRSCWTWPPTTDYKPQLLPNLNLNFSRNLRGSVSVPHPLQVSFPWLSLTQSLRKSNTLVFSNTQSHTIASSCWVDVLWLIPAWSTLSQNGAWLNSGNMAGATQSLFSSSVLSWRSHSQGKTPCWVFFLVFTSCGLFLELTLLVHLLFLPKAADSSVGRRSLPQSGWLFGSHLCSLVLRKPRCRASS